VCVVAGVSATNHAVIAKAIARLGARVTGRASGERKELSRHKFTPPTSAQDLPLVAEADAVDELPPTPGSPAMLPASHSPEKLPDAEIDSLRIVVGLLLPLVRVRVPCPTCSPHGSLWRGGVAGPYTAGLGPDGP
jgi:hypothetical protein